MRPYTQLSQELIIIAHADYVNFITGTVVDERRINFDSYRTDVEPAVIDTNKSECEIR